MKKFVLVIILAFVGMMSKAQWSDDPLINTPVSTASADQVIPHTAYTSDGHFYVGFFCL